MDISWISLISGLFIGAFIGILAMCLMYVGRE